MSERRKTMRCAYCGRTKTLDGFPSSHRGECWSCAWDHHIRDAHPRIDRKIGRQAKRRARQIKRTEVEAAMFAHEKRRALGAPIDEETP